jgi:hypothetical protein
MWKLYENPAVYASRRFDAIGVARFGRWFLGRHSDEIDMS